MADKQVEKNHWLARIQASGYRVTGPRRAIVDLLADSYKALSPLEIYDLGRQEYPRLGLVTVYRTLEKLEELGLVQRVHQPGGCHMVLRACQGHEHLMVCTECGRVEYFTGDDLVPLIENVQNQKGFAIHDHWLQFFGLCSSCQAQKPEPIAQDDPDNAHSQNETARREII
ncbi:MAG TPA: Fur family transcriptional regulator [Anaerolineaceae bacterium]|nr:Fur family transcriptional regulator [Anaerolineaceae bacterium]